MMKMMMKRMAALILVFMISAPAATMADPDQILMIGVKKDAAGTYQNADLEGTWAFGSLGLENFLTLNPEGHTWWGTATFDGTLASLTVNGNDFDSYAGGATSITGTGSFVVNGDGSVDLAYSAPPRTGDPQGYLSANRQYLIAADGAIWTGVVPNDIQLKMDVLIKQSSGKTNADLNGTYYVRQLEFMNTSSADRRASLDWGTITFNDPNYTFNLYAFESDGTTSPLNTGGGTYDVNSDGTVLIHFSGDPDAFGQLSSDGNVLGVSFGRSIGTNTHNGISIAIKEAAGYSNASLAGDYYLTVLAVHDMEEAGRDADLEWGAASFDGAGTVAITGMNEFDADGSPGTTTGSGTYSVDANGEVQIIIDTVDGQPENIVFSGHLSGDWQMLALTSGPDVIVNPGGGGGTSTTTDSGGGGGGGGCFIQALR